MADEYTPQKVRLMTPEGASEQLYLYPVTGLNAITVGTTTSGGAYTTYVAPEGKLLAQYMEIMTTTPTVVAGSAYNYKVDNNRLDFIVSGSTINEAYLKFIVDPNSPNAKIDAKYLPGYVDDVVEVPIKTTDAYPASATFLISAATVPDVGTTYWFYTKNPLTSAWDLGGGEGGKLYVGDGATDGAIYRAVNTSSAVKISESPYGIDETLTNGVRLTRQNNNLAAIANLATTGGPGTIQIAIDAITSSPTRNVWFGLNGGVLSISASLADAANAGAVFVAGTQVQYNALVSAGHPEVSIVPTVDWMQSSISSAIVGVSSATYNNLGIVQIQSGGHIEVTSGIISVPAAGTSVAGVVEIVDNINTATTGNSSKAVTQGGIVQYVSSVVSNYQRTLSPGDGIDIDASGVISIDKTGDALGFSNGSLFVSSATATVMGAVLITGDSSFITGGTAAVDGKPVAVNGAAVRDYVSNVISGYEPSLPVATSATSGTVVIRSLTDVTANDPIYYVAPAKDIKSAIEGHSQISEGTAISITEVASAKQISVKYAAPLSLDGSGNLTIPYATTAVPGAIKLGNGLTSRAGGEGIVDVDISNSAGYVDSPSGNTSGGVEVKLGGIRVVSSYGLAITSGNLYMTPASTGLGGVKKAATNTGIDITEEGIVSAKIDTSVMSFTDGNAISIKPSTVSSGGIVKVLGDSTLVGNSAYDGHVPTVSCLEDYVETSIAGAAVTVVGASGIIVSSSTVGSATTYSALASVSEPLRISGGAISINTATANISGTVGPTDSNTLGAVYVVGTGIRSDFTGVNYTANTVPTESAVRTAINAIPYITWEPINS